jgi:ethanolamine permease
LFTNEDFRAGVIGVALWFLAGLAYFGFYARHRMILSPEEAFAQNQTSLDRQIAR